MQTPLKVLFHDEKGIEPREDGTSNPKYLVGGKLAGEIREGKMLIIGEEAVTERRLEDLKKKDFRERES